MKYLPNWIFEGEASEVPLSSPAHFVMCPVEKGFISKVNSWRLILASTIFKLKRVQRTLISAKNSGCSEVLIFILELLSEVKSDFHEILSGALAYEDL